MTEIAFFQDLAMLMAVAGSVAVIFARLKWPKVIGYILAGVLMSENTWGGSFLADTQSVRVIGQLGVVFLMFSMGLGFSPTKLRKIRSTVMPTAIIDTIVMTWLGYTVGTRVFGWGAVPSLFLGAAICDSATTMLAKIIDEMKWGSKPFVKYTLGSSVCEDIICVGIIAVITGVAAGNGMSISAVGMSLGGLFVFFLATLVLGMAFLPRLLKSIAKSHDDEAMLLAVLGCCFLVSYIARSFEFSLALGAFLVGVICATSDYNGKIESFTSSLRTMFSAVFFVSIGLLVDPSACWHHLPAILLLTAVVVVGKTMNCTFAGVLSGRDIKTSVQLGMSMAQIGEFAFMVALLYLGCAADWQSPMYQITVAVSIISTLLNPLLTRLSEPVGEYAQRRLPSKVKSIVAAYQSFLMKYQSTNDSVGSRQKVNAAALKMGVLAVLVFAISTGLRLLSHFDYTRFSEFFERYDKIFFFVLANIAALSVLPMFIKWATDFGNGLAETMVGGEEARWQQAVRSGIAFLMRAAAVLAFFFEITMINFNLAPNDSYSLWIVSGLLLIAAVVGWRFFAKAGRRAMEHFNEAMSADERREKLEKMLTISLPEDTLHKMTIGLESPAIGETVVSLDIRAKTGMSIVSVVREGAIIRNIGPDFEFKAGDTLVSIGESAKVAALKDLLGITA